MIYPKIRTGEHDAVINGQFVQNVTDRVCYIQSASDLDDIPADYPVGALAVTFDATASYIKMPSGQWQELNADE